MSDINNPTSPGAPQAILLGDSIRGYYQPFVAELLSGTASVSGPDDGGTTRKLLSHLHTWAIEAQPRVIHLNCGLHDLARNTSDNPGGQPRVPLAEYRTNLARIFDSLQEQTSATLVWATTTPVNEVWHHERKGFDRMSADVEAYNQAALEEVAARNIVVDDLFRVVMDIGPDELLTPDGVHFTEDGSRALAQQVAAIIRGILEPG